MTLDVLDNGRESKPSFPWETLKISRWVIAQSWGKLLSDPERCQWGGVGIDSSSLDELDAQ